MLARVTLDRTWRILIFLLGLFMAIAIASAGKAQPVNDHLRAEKLPLTQDPTSTAAIVPIIYLPLSLTNSNQPVPFGPVHAGEGTYYNATGAGNCLFPASPGNLMVAAMNHTDYDMAALCGAYVSVKGLKGSVMVRIVDRCPECPEGDVDLSREAFALIADIPLGRVPITWQLVSPPLSDPIIYHFKDGSNQWWTAVQIRNHRNPIARFEYRAPNGQFKEVSRTEWNYFVEASGMGPGPYTFRVTDVFGHTIIESGIPHIENGSVSGTSQFPPPP